MGTQNYDDGIVVQINPVLIRRKTHSFSGEVPQPVTYERYQELMKERAAHEHPE